MERKPIKLESGSQGVITAIQTRGDKCTGVHGRAGREVPEVGQRLMSRSCC